VCVSLIHSCKSGRFEQVPQHQVKNIAGQDVNHDIDYMISEDLIAANIPIPSECQACYGTIKIFVEFPRITGV
jgi:hypothetical protein